MTEHPRPEDGADDYLFDPAAPADPEIAAWERKLAPLRYRAPRADGEGSGAASSAADSTESSASARATHTVSDRGISRRSNIIALVVCLAAVAGVAAVALMHGLRPGSDAADHDRRNVDDALPLRVLAGAPRLGNAPAQAVDLLRPDAILTTDGSSRARVELAAGGANWGRLDVEPDSVLRLVRAGRDEQRMALERGEIRALTWAPPRLLFIETPAATAVDLGCAFVMKVDDAGHGRLSVTAGYVAFERDGREALVPRGASCRTERDRGPGTPFFDDAAPALLAALERFDFGAEGARAVPDLLAADLRPRDSLTLWHVLPRVEGEDRRAVADRLFALAPPPPDVARDAVLRLDPNSLEIWRAALRAHW